MRASLSAFSTNPMKNRQAGRRWRVHGERRRSTSSCARFLVSHWHSSVTTTGRSATTGGLFGSVEHVAWCFLGADRQCRRAAALRSAGAASAAQLHQLLPEQRDRVALVLAERICHRGFSPARRSARRCSSRETGHVHALAGRPPRLRRFSRAAGTMQGSPRGSRRHRPRGRGLADLAFESGAGRFEREAVQCTPA